MHRMRFVLFISLLVSAGCLERRETITVRPDLSVQIAIDYSGSREDLEGPDAMPSEATGWQVERGSRRQGGEERQVLEATAEFAAGAALPGSYAKTPGPYLEFPTTVQVEKRTGGDLVHFRRVYRPRAFARFHYWNDRIIDDDIKKLAEKPRGDLSENERSTLLRAMAEVEARKRVEIANAAVAASVPTVPQDAWLKARRALLAVFEQIDIEKLASELSRLDEAAGDARISALAESVPADADKAFVEALAEAAKLDDAAVQALRSALATETLRMRVTQSNGSHGFRIALTMPGAVVAHNGDRIEDGAIVWEFMGNAFFDREYELLATARLPRGEP